MGQSLPLGEEPSHQHPRCLAVAARGEHWAVRYLVYAEDDFAHAPQLPRLDVAGARPEALHLPEVVVRHRQGPLRWQALPLQLPGVPPNPSRPHPQEHMQKVPPLSQAPPLRRGLQGHGGPLSEVPGKRGVEAAALLADPHLVRHLVALGLVGEVCLPPRPRAHHGQLQLLHHGPPAHHHLQEPGGPRCLAHQREHEVQGTRGLGELGPRAAAEDHSLVHEAV
mmetsp:Transcript_9247/g.22689  ORF Transcript_9247/g.22689 Transcript_9247/m.22689 type:complete len:223 (-) Transcript_9247:1558-2226(-)